MMAAELGDMAAAPVDYQDYASEAEELADLTADNRIAELATTDNKLLAEVFADIDTGEIPFMLSGYTEEDYGNIVTALSEALHTEEPKGDPDAEIPPRPEPVTKYGDLWILGRHRVLCGDCTHPEDCALLLDGAKPEILLTDPPYCSGGQKEAQKSTGSIGTERKDGKAPKIANDILSTRGYQNLIRAALTDIPCLYAYIFTDWRMWVYLFDLVEAAGFGVKSELVWDKGTPGMGVGWRSQHELILFAARAATHFDGHKGYGNVLSVSRSGNELHPTQKPVELLEKLVDNTDFARGVYDPFGGSGSTLIACEQTDRICRTIELDEKFCDVIVNRYIEQAGTADGVSVLGTARHTVMGRLRMERNKLTLGSLFDGSGGFPLGGLLSGITPVWASEIEPFPIRVTTKRLPFMKHYGDVSRMDGGKIEPVDIITFGSPCQDMSIAGRREGLDGSRSSLFYEAVRIVKEMRCATDGRYPRYIVWENVPGAFSSNKGADFQSVLEEICSAKGYKIDPARPAKWPAAGEIVADDFSLAWRVFDAQYWGVPQRRKRIYLVADFAGGSAGKILFESEGMSGYTPQGFRPWQGAAGAFKEGAGASGCVCLNDQGGSRMDVTEDVAHAPGGKPRASSLRDGSCRILHRAFRTGEGHRV